MRGMHFNDVHSWDDLGLVLSQVDIPPAQAKTNYIDIPAGDGSVDLSEALGEVKFSDRQASFIFSVLPHDNFEEKKTELNRLLNGRKMTIRLDKDAGYHWTGRCSVNEYDSDKNVHKITVGATLAPYKYRDEPTTASRKGSGSLVIVNGGRKTAIPTITTTATSKITFNGDTFDVSAGTHKILDLAFITGEHTITITQASTATTTLTWIEGDL